MEKRKKEEKVCMHGYMGGYRYGYGYGYLREGC